LPYLRNTRNTLGPPLLAAGLLVAMLLSELALAGLVLSGLSQLDAPAATAVFLLPPLGALVSPLVGLAAVTSRQPWLHRVHASINLMTVNTAIIALALCLHDVSTGAFDDRLGVICPVFLLAVKLAVIPVAHARIAQLDLDADTRTLSVDAVAFVRESFITLKGGAWDAHGAHADGGGLGGLAGAAGAAAGAGSTGAADADAYQRLLLGTPVAGPRPHASVADGHGREHRRAVRQLAAAFASDHDGDAAAGDSVVGLGGAEVDGDAGGGGGISPSASGMDMLRIRM
jgi:hypothetical protein